MGENNGHNFRIFLASFLTIFANGVAFSVRGAILGDWAQQFGFTKGELGNITGGGLWGFGLIIIISSLFMDKIGYKPILLIAFLLHVVSGVITLSASHVFETWGREATYNCLNWSLIMFAVANGLCEGAVNPLVATLYPKQKTHYLNILHASWPGGLIVGGLLAYCFSGFEGGAPAIQKLRWEIPLSMFLVPVLLYGLLVALEKMPQSEAQSAGVTLGEMLSYLASPLLILLLVLHAMVGYVELGTDSWVTNIMGNVIREDAILLFIYTSALMFVLRFFAGPIVERINPLGLLAISSVLGVIGLRMLSVADAAAGAFVAATIYGVGKTFLWPTMLGVAGERFPRGGAVVMGALGGVGMLSAGLLGGPVIGYKQDYFASQQLKEQSAATYDRYQAEKASAPLPGLPEIKGLDGSKVGVVLNKGEDLERDVERLRSLNRTDEGAKTLEDLATWWGTAKTFAKEDQPLVESARLFGGRQALSLTSWVPATMAVLFTLLVLYFRATGGYKQLHISGEPTGPAEY